jgi:metal-dependent hydrolase (beta-lactamase superfamily II)
MNAQNDVKPLSWKVFTIIYGETDAILVDVFLTIEQSNQLVHWLYESGKNLKAIYLTHAHADHIYGAKIITDHFPQAKVVALPALIEDIPKEIDKEYIANLWDKLFLGNIPQEFVMHDAIQNNELEIEGHKLIVENIGFSDTGNTTYLYVPSIGLVVAGDIDKPIFDLHQGNNFIIVYPSIHAHGMIVYMYGNVVPVGYDGTNCDS